MTPVVDIQNASTEAVPRDDELSQWVNTALAYPPLNSCPFERPELSIRLVDRPEMSTLNTTYRGAEGPTNVLSFPADLPPELNLPLLGDIVICAPLVHEEASRQRKNDTAHWAHLTVHGVLHLLGYDHVLDNDASIMESFETAILAQLNFPCPYTEALHEEH